MSDDSLERRRKEREARRKEREEALKKEEEELERQREERKRERERRAEERRQQEQKEEEEEAARRAARRAPVTGDSDRGREEAEQAKRREEEREKERKREEEERAAKRKEEERKREEEEKEKERRRADEDSKRKEEAEAEERRKERERKRREEDEAATDRKRAEERERKRKEEEDERAEEERRKERERKKRQEEEEERAEEERRNERKKRQEHEEEEAAAASRRNKKSDGDAAAMSQLKEENASLKAANKKLQSDLAAVTDEADGVRLLLVEAQKENAALKKELEALKAAAASAPKITQSQAEEEAAPAPRLTTATKGRPTKAGRRGAATLRPTATASADDDEKEEAEEKPAEKPVARSTGNMAADMLAATMRNASMSGGTPTLRKPAGGNVFVSAGTKGGEISRCLFQLKGKTRIRGVRVQDSPNSITQNDVFILETKTHIWTYIGKNANRLKIARAVDVVGKMQRQRGQARAATLETVDTKSEHDDGMERKRKAFWGEFEAGEPKSIPEGEDDTQWELDYEARTNLSLVEPGFQLTLIAQGKLKQEDLESDKVYLLDTPNEVFVWCGKSSDMNLRKEAVERAQEMVTKAIADGQKPSWVEVERIAEKGEGALFEDKFFSWSDSMRAVIGKVAHKALSNVAVSDASKRQELPRILLMHDGELEPPREYTSDVSGTPEIFLVKDFKRADLPKEEYGTFYSKQCYILLYRYEDTGVFYYWIGRDAGVTETGTAASLAKAWAGECGLNRPNLVRVDQGKENSHFLRLFKGRMVVFLGDRGSQDSRTKALFHLRGTEPGNTRSFECPDVNGVYLNSDDAFVLNTKESQYLWLGEYANSHLRTIAEHVCDVVRGSRSGSTKTEIEGKESGAFKDAIGWTDGYARHETRPNDLPVKFFLCSNSNKQYRADRTADFVQSDLSHSHQAILDRYSEVIVWLGRDTSAEDKRIALEVAVDYVEKANDGRKDCHVWAMDEGDEVVDYSRYFQAWDPYKVRSAKKNITQRPPLIRRESSLAKARDLLSSSDGSAKYPLKTLLDRDYLPAGVDKRTLENYLRDEDFPEAFGMTAKEFFALPAWKRLEKKKTSPLF